MMEDGNLLICGTNAYKPLCRQYGYEVSKTWAIFKIYFTFTFDAKLAINILPFVLCSKNY